MSAVTPANASAASMVRAWASATDSGGRLIDYSGVGQPYSASDKGMFRRRAVESMPEEELLADSHAHANAANTSAGSSPRLSARVRTMRALRASR
ncbi:MAG: hypothetical protein L0K12_13490, partial [Brevibacterium aurantiacum]|nr:hypothetical protein [Brevibacterium aurantiacum]